MTAGNKSELSTGLEGGAEVLTWGRASEARAGDTASAAAGQTGGVWTRSGAGLTARHSSL